MLWIGSVLLVLCGPGANGLSCGTIIRNPAAKADGFFQAAFAIFSAVGPAGPQKPVIFLEICAFCSFVYSVYTVFPLFFVQYCNFFAIICRVKAFQTGWVVLYSEGKRPCPAKGVSAQPAMPADVFFRFVCVFKYKIDSNCNTYLQ